MRKQSQFYNSAMQGKTLEDLFVAIRGDLGMSSMEKAQVLSQVKGLTGWAGGNTPLSALMMKGLGGTIGWLISKYFGMGPVGQLVSAVSGFGIGNVINKHLNKPKEPYPGWKMMGEYRP